jgi:hypothetical protein
MAAILCAQRAQVSLGSFPPQSRYALMLRLHKSRLGRSSPVSLCADASPAQVSLGSFPPQSRYALMLRLHKSRLGRSLPSLAMHKIATAHRLTEAFVG